MQERYYYCQGFCEALSLNSLNPILYQGEGEKNVEYKKVKTGIDLLTINFSYIFNLYFKESIRIIEENHYLEKLYNRFKFNDQQTKERIEEIYTITKKYLEEKKDD